MSVQIEKNSIIKVGGNGICENILKNSATLTGKTASTTFNGITTGQHNGTSGWSEAYWPCSISASGNPLSGKICTISLDFMTTDISKISSMYFGFGTFNSSGNRVADLNVAVSSYTVMNGTLSNNTWCRISNTFTIPSTWATEASTYRLQIKTSSGANGASMYHKRIKVELNDYPTNWTMCNDDVGFNMIKGFIEYQSYNTPFLPVSNASDSMYVTEINEVF